MVINNRERFVNSGPPVHFIASLVPFMLTDSGTDTTAVDKILIAAWGSGLLYFEGQGLLCLYAGRTIAVETAPDFPGELPSQGWGGRLVPSPRFAVPGYAIRLGSHIQDTILILLPHLLFSLVK